VQEWPFAFKFDKIPAEQVDAISLSSLESLQICLSPASFESLRDCLELVNDLSHATSPANKRAVEVVCDAESSTGKEIKATADQTRELVEQNEALNLFEIMNRAGLGLKCYPATETGLRGQDLTPSNIPAALLFRPATEFVHMPELGRKARLYHSTVCQSLPLATPIQESSCQVTLAMRLCTAFFAIAIRPSLCRSNPAPCQCSLKADLWAASHQSTTWW
jgi:hypothetical protein